MGAFQSDETMRCCSTALLLGAFVALCAASNFPVRRSEWQWMNQKLDALGDYTPLNFTEEWITQPIDHNNVKLGTWQQYYQVMDQYQDKKSNSSLVFLMIGGEGPISKAWISNPNLQYLQWAKKFGALCFQVEHRFFGVSRPYPDMTTKSLKYLTTQLALADLASFIDSVNANATAYGLTNPRWITFGGSYPGSMAAWFRSKYPNKTIGSVASSAPLNLKLDFYEYTMVMQDTISTVSKACYDAVNATFTTLQTKTLTAAGRTQLNAAFKPLKLTPEFNDKDLTWLQVTNFLGNIYNTFQGVIQYTYDGRNNETVGGLNVAAMCNVLTTSIPKAPKDTDYLSAVVKVIQWNNALDLKFNGAPDGPFNNDYQQGIAMTQSPSFNTTIGDPDGRGWMWLCCNEIGFLQTTSEGYNIFQDIVPLGFYLRMCTDLFGPTINATYVRDHNRAAQKYYGGLDSFNATNLVLPNGSLDPWHALGYYKADNASRVLPLLISGTAHCSDMYASYTGEPKALIGARDSILKEVSYYISSSTPQKKKKSSSSIAFSALVALVAVFVNRFF